MADHDGDVDDTNCENNDHTKKTANDICPEKTVDSKMDFFQPPANSENICNEKDKSNDTKLNSQISPLPMELERNNWQQLMCQGRQQIILQYLSPWDKQLILDNIWRGTDQRTVFTSLLHNRSTSLPYDTVVLQNLNKINPVPENPRHI